MKISVEKVVYHLRMWGFVRISLCAILLWGWLGFINGLETREIASRRTAWLLAIASIIGYTFFVLANLSRF